jgi:hypothetical protein
MAESRKEAGPESTFMDFTRPAVSTTASRVTVAVLSLAKYSNALGEAIARTDLISFGGAIATPCESGTAEASVVLMDGRGTARFAADVASADFSGTAGGSTAASAGVGGSGLASVGDASSLGAVCAAPFESAGG